MTKEQRAILIAFSAVQGVGRKTLEKIEKYVSVKKSSWQKIWSGEVTAASDPLTEKQRHYLLEFQKRHTPLSYQEMLHDRGIDVTTDSDQNYPRLLREVGDRPKVLYVRGPASFWDTQPVAVVGTRHPTSYGQLATKKIVSELCAQGCTVISGFMYGIDVCAHRAAVSCGGKSVGVLGFGFDFMFPATQTQFLQEFLELGNTCVTEFCPETAPQKGNFPLRNRIVAGMTMATVVVEAGERSGSLITAQLALDYNRAVYAVPGPITSQYSEGTKNLLNEGAELITSGYDVCAGRKSDQSSSLEFPPNQAVLYQKISEQPSSIDQLCTLVGMSLSEVSHAVTLLEMKGVVKKEGNIWQLCM